jgi:Protein of unknown function (DUF1236)
MHFQPERCGLVPGIGRDKSADVAILRWRRAGLELFSYREKHAIGGNQRLPASFAFFAQQKEEADLKRILITGALVASALSMSTMAMAQGGVAGGAVGGAIVGGAVGGPVGAAVGAAAGATAGGIADDARPRFHSYVVERRHPSYRYQSDVRIGAELPDAGVTYYEVPREYGATQYRYTVVNDRTVLVDPATHRIVQVVD